MDCRRQGQVHSLEDREIESVSRLRHLSLGMGPEARRSSPGLSDRDLALPRLYAGGGRA